jgi:hypothetical protein
MKYLASKKHDIFNSSDPFYTDYCQHFTSKNSSSDVTMEDRKKFYVGVKFCEENCIYSGFDTETYFVNCSCPVKNYSSSNERIFKENKIDENFNKTYESSSFKILKCSSNVFELKMFIYNFGLYYGLISVVLVIIYAYKFYKAGFDFLPKFIENIKLLKKFNTQYDMRISKYNKNHKIHNNENFNFNKSSSRKIASNPPRKMEHEEDNSNKNDSNIKQYTDNSNNSDEMKNNNIDEKIKEYYSNKRKKSFKYSNEEINDMNFEDSIKNDKRKFSQIYYSFLQNSQLIIFTFCNKSDYNICVLKKQLFFFVTLLHLIINIILFNDNDVAYIYKNKNAISYLFKKIIYSFLICTLITFVLKFLCLTGKTVKKLVSMNNEEKFQEKMKFEKIFLIVKTILFQIICVFFTFFSWFYMTLFFGVYRNSIIILLKLFLITYCLTMSYPFILCGIGTVFRIFSLSHEIKFLFYLSKIFT